MTNNYGISDKSWKLLIEVISSFKVVEKALIFGSRAKGNFKNGSDIDVAIYGKNINEKAALDISSKLNEEIPSPYFYDVVAVNSISNQNLQSHIERMGKIFYENSSTGE